MKMSKIRTYLSKVVLTALLITGFQSNLLAQYNPHKNQTDYKEDYRGQFHFSPKSEWMNDINGLVYHDGKYHMIYQWGKKIRHGGYATSADLLHWKDEGVALIPQKSFLPEEAVRNVSGDQVYSGSAVKISGETARKITGSDQEAIVAIYTGTAEGTCLAWSADNGTTWHDYKNNPVGNFTKGTVPRDPCVFWHDESQKWVLAIYENGTTFYNSDDLISWNFLSNIKFGYECPDIFRLPVDGDADNMKWVLQDANGTYLVGEFDGKQFVPDERQKKQVMDVGPDFYAAQTFPMGNLPNQDDRIIQIAWMDHWNGGIGEVGWERNATFPVSIGLVSYNGQKRITRNPIKEISKLYKNNKSWKNVILKSGENPLEDIRSKTFDLEIEVDLSESEALTFGVKVANKYIVYDMHNSKLMSRELLPDDENHVVIRLLVDWGQLEVFGNGGIYSYTQQFAFAPDSDEIVLFTDGKVKIVSMDFHEIKSIWD